ncbi:MAG: D-alanine transfer protein [Sphingobacteriales bacterium]|jgi:D-alanine transfer protein
MKGVLFRLILPLIGAFGISSLCFHGLVNWKTKQNENRKTILSSFSGEHSKKIGKYINLADTAHFLDYLGSLSAKNQLTLFGSSEFTNDSVCSYYFFPNQLNIPALGIGHAYHQSLSIYGEIMAGEPYLDRSKICILISPGWFESDGTNPEAFLEFAPNFLLNQIIFNPSISTQHKRILGKFIDENAADFSGFSSELGYLRNSFRQGEAWKSKLFPIPLTRPKKQLKFSVKAESTTPYSTQPSFSFTDTLQQEIHRYSQEPRNNTIHVNDAYFSRYLKGKGKGGSDKKGNVHSIDIGENPELKNLQVLIQFLKEKNVDASFVIQPLNPYYYNGIENLVPILDSVESVIRQNQFPCLNMYVSDTTNYIPGTLNDVMHLGKIGWLNVNQFLYQTYYQTDEEK